MKPGYYGVTAKASGRHRNILKADERASLRLQEPGDFSIEAIFPSAEDRAKNYDAASAARSWVYVSGPLPPTDVWWTQAVTVHLALICVMISLGATPTSAAIRVSQEELAACRALTD